MRRLDDVLLQRGVDAVRRDHDVSGSLLAVFGDYARMGSMICLIYLLGLLVISHCPETKGKPLPE